MHASMSMWTDSGRFHFGGELDYSQSPFYNYFRSLRRIACAEPVAANDTDPYGPAWLYAAKSSWPAAPEPPYTAPPPPIPLPAALPAPGISGVPHTPASPSPGLQPAGSLPAQAAMGAAAPSPASSRQGQANTTVSPGQASAPSSTAVTPVPRPAAAQLQVQALPTRAALPLPPPAPAPVSEGAPAVAAPPLWSSPQLTAAVKPSAPANPVLQPAQRAMSPAATQMSVTVSAQVILAAAAPAAPVATALALKPLPQQQQGHIPTMVLPPAEVRAPSALELGQMQAKQAPLRASHPAVHDSTTGAAHRRGPSRKASAGSRRLH